MILRAIGSPEATDDPDPQRFYHGTKADLKPGELIEPGRPPNFGKLDRKTTFVYLTATLDAATWGAELPLGVGLGRIYIVEPTGPIMDDPNLTDKKFPGNPTNPVSGTTSPNVRPARVFPPHHRANASKPAFSSSDLYPCARRRP